MTPYVQRKCVNCRILFNICGPCFRGQRSCSTACQKLRARRLHRQPNARYDRSPKGRKSSQIRQNRYRLRLKAAHHPRLITHHTKNCVTDATSTRESDHLKLKASRSGDVQRCQFCRRDVHWHLQDSPRPSTHWRRHVNNRRIRKHDQQRPRV